MGYLFKPFKNLSRETFCWKSEERLVSETINDYFVIKNVALTQFSVSIYGIGQWLPYKYIFMHR